MADAHAWLRGNGPRPGRARARARGGSAASRRVLRTGGDGWGCQQVRRPPRLAGDSQALAALRSPGGEHLATPLVFIRARKPWVFLRWRFAGAIGALHGNLRMA
jgi:hypothetical protein